MKKIKHFLFPLFLVVFSSFIVPPSSFCDDVPSVINYQGLLTDNLGNAVTSGYYHIEFRVWDHPTLTGAGDLIWGRMFPLHVMTDGSFNVLLSDDGGAVSGPTPQTNDLSQAFAGPDRYLGLTITETPTGVVGSPSEISPRQRLVSAPYSFHAENASYAADAEFALYASNAAFAADAAAATSGFTVDGNLTVQSGQLIASEQAELNGGLKVQGVTALQGAVGVAGAVTFSNQVVAKSNVTVHDPAQFVGYGTIPIGGIIIWSGLDTAVPSGWAICDGQTHNGHTTPDLRDRFIVGVSSTYAVGATGGTNEVTLLGTQIPPHSHGYTYYEKEVKDVCACSGQHHNLIQGDSTHTDTDNSGGGLAHENRPPYYAVYYIMRVK